ncbi:UV DNA damage repair endonuclease UvsE [Clostridium sp.]|uniref:UV DNA damage repair endonuclease UvsE n=1 Tax=Clostridium sp. TaxID=1506 RepID=UPI002FC7B23F
MKIRLGYVAISLKLPKVTSSSNVTFSYYSKLSNKEKRFDKLKTVTRSNLDDLYTILKYNVENKIHFYRITSALVPLSTHPEVTEWNYREVFKKYFEAIGEYIKVNNLRVDTHPDQFNVINSAKPQVVENTIRNLLFHSNFFQDINYPEGKMVIHVGSGEGGKEVALERFVKNFKALPVEIGNRLIIENDDKTFTARETLELCSKIQCPMVLDTHHHKCNNNGEEVIHMLEGAFHTWSNQKQPPKIHYSTPREFENDRKHADYIDGEEFVEFIESAKEINIDFDVMLEAKMKDLALYKLIEDIKRLRPNWQWEDNSTFIVD